MTTTVKDPTATKTPNSQPKKQDPTPPVPVPGSPEEIWARLMNSQADNVTLRAKLAAAEAAADTARTDVDIIIAAYRKAAHVAQAALLQQDIEHLESTAGLCACTRTLVDVLTPIATSLHLPADHPAVAALAKAQTALRATSEPAGEEQP